MSERKHTESISVDHLSKISHDFKTPINIILSSASLIRLRSTSLSRDPSELQKYVHYIEQNCHRLLRLVDSLLRNSRSNTSVPPLLTSRCDLHDFLKYTLEDLRLYSSQRDIELYFRNRLTAPCILNVDRDQLERILMNLFSNAVKHTPPGGTIIVALNADDDFAYISVIDDGEGIDPSFLPDLFKPYRTRASRISPDDPGTGLGLPIAKELAALHGGTISVSSSPGMGSCFTLSLSRHLPLTTELINEEPA